ncbi:ATP-binding protein [Ruminococcus sp.]|uniref:sensor histidine kinase n=1 Tax=Ruminococcus sp. TaxID=41978 RepID=UPI0025FB64A5|nr:ATP-binding protein [Ruminococcus sp.]
MKYIIIVLSAAVICVLIFAAVKLIRRKFYNLIDRRIERFQSELIEKQVNEIQNMYRQVRGWRHDYRNHIQNMKILLSEDNYTQLDGYLDELAEDLNTVDTVIKTGNIMADAVLNSKLNVAEKLDIKTTVKVQIPENIPLTDVELCAVLGNLLDNAAEACQKLEVEERFLRVYISKLKGQFYISVQNAAGKVNKISGVYRSTKEGEHGYGLFRIDRIAKKYGGYVNRQNEEGVFATEIMLPLSS